MPAQARIDYQAGSARVTSAGAFLASDGNVQSVLRTGTGVYELTMSPQMSGLEHVAFVQVINATAVDLCANLEPVSASIYRVRGVSNDGSGPAAADIAFFFEINRVRNQ